MHLLLDDIISDFNSFLNIWDKKIFFRFSNFTFDISKRFTSHSCEIVDSISQLYSQISDIQRRQILEIIMISSFLCSSFNSFFLRLGSIFSKVFVFGIGDIPLQFFLTQENNSFGNIWTKITSKNFFDTRIFLNGIMKQRNDNKIKPLSFGYFILLVDIISRRHIRENFIEQYLHRSRKMRESILRLIVFIKRSSLIIVKIIFHINPCTSKFFMCPDSIVILSTQSLFTKNFIKNFISPFFHIILLVFQPQIFNFGHKYMCQFFLDNNLMFDDIMENKIIKFSKNRSRF